MQLLFQPGRRNSFVRGILIILTGILILSLPEITVKTAIMTLGAMILVNNLFNLIFSFVRDKKGGGNPLSFGGTMIALLFLISPMSVAAVFGVFFGIILLMLGIVLLFLGLSIFSRSVWSWLVLFLGVITISGGLFLFLHPIESAEKTLSLFGGILIFYGLVELLIYWKFKKQTTVDPSKDIIDTTYEEVK